jgi:hypothetical protein
MKLCVMILAVGDIFYKEDSLKVLRHYFAKHNISYYLIEEAPHNIDLRNSHPSWWKLLCHKIIPDYDYIICWDLDLLPIHSDVDFLQYFNFNKITMAIDSCAKHYPHLKYNSNFKYNGGLIGIPKILAFEMEDIFNKYAPGTRPSWEQYYLNDTIVEKGLVIHKLPDTINVLYSAPDFSSALIKHYTFGVNAKEHIKHHDYK